MERKQKRQVKVLVIIPAYNEENSILNVINKLKTTLINSQMDSFTDILVVNDASKDKTSSIARSKCIKVIDNIQNLGYGGSLQIGYRYALNQGYDFTIQMDADGQHDTCNIPKIYRALTQDANKETRPDIVLGSRFLKDSISFEISAPKKFAIWYFSSILRLSTKQFLTDPTTGLQGLNKAVIYYYSRFNQFDGKYPDSNILLEAARAGFKIKEIPAVMYAREDGTSMHSGFKPIYYMMHMSLSVLSVLVRKDLKDRHKKAVLYSLLH